MARAPFDFIGTQIKAGTRQTVEVPVAKLSWSAGWSGTDGVWCHPR